MDPIRLNYITLIIICLLCRSSRVTRLTELLGPHVLIRYQLIWFYTNVIPIIFKYSIEIHQVRHSHLPLSCLFVARTRHPLYRYPLRDKRKRFTMSEFGASRDATKADPSLSPSSSSSTSSSSLSFPRVTLKKYSAVGLWSRSVEDQESCQICRQLLKEPSMAFFTEYGLQYFYLLVT